MIELRFVFDRIWSLYSGVGISLSEKQLGTLHPADRKELADFFKKELNRAREQKLCRIHYSEWGLWNLLDYIPKVCLLVPEGDDFYDVYKCEF